MTDMNEHPRRHLTGEAVALESNDPGSKADMCESDAPMSEELYTLAKHIEQVIYRDAETMGRVKMESIYALKQNLIVWIFG